MIEKARAGVLPEDIQYNIVSCAARGGCSDPFNCPFDICIYDQPSKRALASRQLVETVRQLRDSGMLPRDIAARMGLSKRWVFKLLGKTAS